MDRRRGVRGAKSIGYLYDYPLLPINHDERSSSSPRTLLRGARGAATDARERADNLERHAEEAEALGAIYGDDFLRRRRRLADTFRLFARTTPPLRRGRFSRAGRADGARDPGRTLPRAPAVEIEPASAPFARHDVAMRAGTAFADAAGEVPCSPSSSDSGR